MNLFVVVTAALATQAVPADWSCDAERYADGVCDCGCTALDDADCGSASFTACDVSRCADGNVPWKDHNPGCMTNTCGDGWKADDEVCDDGDGAGCADDCGSVEVGFFCGPRADGCTDSNPVVEDPVDVDNGCATAGVVPPLGALFGLLGWRRRRR